MIFRSWEVVMPPNVDSTTSGSCSLAGTGRGKTGAGRAQTTARAEVTRSARSLPAP